MLVRRLRRNRKNAAIRSLICEHRVTAAQLIHPFFVKEGRTEELPSLPGMNRWSTDDLLRQIETSVNLGIRAIALFPVVDSSLKDEEGSEAIAPDNLLHRSIRLIKREFPDVILMTDVALDPYTTHGHDGFYDAELDEVLNDLTVERLAVMAVCQAEAGSDMIAPSDMMDGRVATIRRALDNSGFEKVNIHAYAAKYASSLYGPFRDTVGSGLKQGDKRGYQLPPTNVREALLEAFADEQEGADMLMVKPAGYYLDVIHRLKENTHLPISAYQVSGEYAMIKAAAMRGWVDEKLALWESVLAIKRAGADCVITYAAPQIAQWVNELNA